VPVLTALSAVPLLGERLSLRLVTAGLLIVAGIALAVIARTPR
jgi:drug/metabolite transporter (DMT)-like permease